MKRLMFALSFVLGITSPLSAQILSGTIEVSQVTQPFTGKDLAGWKFKGDEKKSQWQVGRAALDEKNLSKLTFTPLAELKAADPALVELVNVSSGVDIYTTKKYGDVVVTLDFMVPKGSNSGIYLMGEYEVQILDSFGREKLTPGDLGGLYNTAAPRVNAAKKPGEWQKFVIDFQAPKFDAAGKKTSNARFLKITLNDQVIHENVEMKGPTTSALTGRESATGPLLFQGDHGPVSFRNISIAVKIHDGKLK